MLGTGGGLRICGGETDEVADKAERLAVDTPDTLIFRVAETIYSQ